MTIYWKSNASKCIKMQKLCQNANRFDARCINQSIQSLERDELVMADQSSTVPKRTLKGQIAFFYRLFVAIAHELLWALLPKNLSMRDVVLNILNFEDKPTPISTKRFQKPIVASHFFSEKAQFWKHKSSHFSHSLANQEWK